MVPSPRVEAGKGVRSGEMVPSSQVETGRGYREMVCSPQIETGRGYREMYAQVESRRECREMAPSPQVETRRGVQGGSDTFLSGRKEKGTGGKWRPALSRRLDRTVARGAGRTWSRSPAGTRQWLVGMAAACWDVSCTPALSDGLCPVPCTASGGSQALVPSCVPAGTRQMQSPSLGFAFVRNSNAD